MSSRDELEAALRARPDDATLVVYADLLQSQGDPRGELIALDLSPPELSTNGLEVRRGQLLQKWLGDDFELTFDREQQLWYAGELTSSFATFHCGFIDLTVTDFDYTADLVVPKLLDTPAGEYLRRLSLSGSTAMLEPLLDKLAQRPRSWLQQLALTRPAHETPLLVAPAVAARLARATPNLEVLELSGRNLFDRFAHPALRELAVTGSEAIDLAKGAPLPALHTIDYAFEEDRPTPKGLFGPERLPALRRLDLAREEPGARQLFDVLGTLAIAGQLTHLVLPAIRTDDDQVLVQAAIDRMPLLREITIARAYECHGPIPPLRHAWARMKLPEPFPWPPRETLVDEMLVIDGFSTDVSELVEILEAVSSDLTTDDLVIWFRFWHIVDGVAAEGVSAFHAADLERALAALPLTTNLGALRDHLRRGLARRPQGYFATLRWA